ncbi:MAG: hypothetical protein PVG14_19215, partial [Anaerolineales bacterium]
YQFDFYDGGGLDLAFLSFAQVDADGSVNVSRFGERVIGIGGFQNIAQNAKKMIFSGTFTAGGLEIEWVNGQTHIRREGRYPKFVAQLGQVSYNGRYAAQQSQEALYITERAVFQRDAEGLVLTEVAPGIDLKSDVLAHMEFHPQVSPDLKIMDARLFRPDLMGYASELALKPRLNIPKRLRNLE